MQVWVQSLFLFALVWSVGANTDEEGRTTFDHMLRKLLINDPPADLKPYIKVSLTVIHYPWSYTHTTLQEMSKQHAITAHQCMSRPERRSKCTTRCTHATYGYTE